MHMVALKNIWWLTDKAHPEVQQVDLIKTNKANFLEYGMK